MYPIPSNETLVETKVCKHCNVSFPITNKDLEFYEKVSPVFNGQKYQIPTPTLCPDCRQQRRLSFRNERKLYKRKCDATGRDIISIYSPDKPFKVYHQDFWWSDKWDPMDYGRDFDFSRGFFEQFGELMREVPQLSLIIMNPENSEYTSGGVGNKNCYMVFLSSNNSDCYYDYWIFDSHDLMDCTVANKSSFCYECYQIENCSSCYFSGNLKNCYNCYNCHDCIGCNNCIDCHDIKNQEYVIDNKKVTPDEFKERYKLLQFSKKFHKKSFYRAYDIIGCENVSGDEISNVNNGFMVFGGKNAENIKYIYDFLDIKDSYDVNSQAYTCSLLYENYGIENINKSIGIHLSVNINDSYYSIYSFDSSHLFGCIGLRNKSYCILNKQYTKEEYEVLVPKIIEHMTKTGEWGEFFPSSLSPFGYNETVAMEYYPLSRDVALQRLYNWSDYEAPFPKVEKIIPAAKLPDDISKIPDDILNWAIECEVTGKPFRIIKQELEFYRKHNLPIPRRHPDQRHLDRMSLRNPRKLFERKCDKCGVEMMTTYAPCDSLEVPLGCSPERPEVVYCEGCYNKEVIG